MLVKDGANVHVIPVTKIDGRPIGSGQPGPLTKRILDAFHKMVREG